MAVLVGQEETGVGPEQGPGSIPNCWEEPLGIMVVLQSR